MSQLKFGACLPPEQAPVLAAAGFDYLEVNVQSHLKPLASEEEAASALDLLRGGALPSRAANCFLPGSLKVTGPAVDWEALASYVENACRRARGVGLDRIVFGSGGARQIPEGFAREEAWEQLIRFGRMAGESAARQDVVIVLEPLNRRECNVINSVAEGADLVRAVGHPHFQLLVDAYHWALESEPVSSIVEAGSLLRHAHLATYSHRKAPGMEECDFAPFFSALHQSGYSGLISIEGGWGEVGAEAGPALSLLRQEAARAGFTV